AVAGVVGGRGPPEVAGEEAAAEAVARDEVARASEVAAVVEAGPADLVARCPVEQIDAVGPPGRGIGHGPLAGPVGADEVALDEVGGRLNDEDSPARVDGDDVAGPGKYGVGDETESADEILGGPRVDPHAGVAVCFRPGAADVRTNEIALHQVARGPRAGQVYAVGGIEGHKVGGPGGGAADGVAAGAAVEQDALGAVA